MKSCLYSGHAALRREFKNVAEISEVINRGPNYILDRLNGKRDFTEREKRILLRHLGADPEDQQTKDFYFSEVGA